MRDINESARGSRHAAGGRGTVQGDDEACSTGASVQAPDVTGGALVVRAPTSIPRRPEAGEGVVKLRREELGPAAHVQSDTTVSANTTRRKGVFTHSGRHSTQRCEAPASR